MALCSDAVWNLNSNHLKILEAAEKITSSDEYFQETQLRNKSHLKANFSEHLMDLISVKFITYRSKMLKLSISGLDCLAINTLRKNGLDMMGSNIAIGKESDIYYGEYKGAPVAIKINRLGRTSFQKVNSREIKNDSNWHSINKENSRKEAFFLNLFKDLDIPTLLDYDRHVMVMELLDYTTLYRVKIDNPEIIAAKMIGFIKKLWDLGYVHGDFNEFNIMIKEDEIKILDFSQCILKDDPKAHSYLKKDIECAHDYFWRRYFYIVDDSALREIYDSTDIKINVERKIEEKAINPRC